jgi:DNA-binding transcriptional MocR family regulator
MIPDAFAAALRTSPAVVLLQPRAHNPTGISMTLDRAKELAYVLYRARTAENAIVLEDDHSGAISSAPVVTFASWMPERVLHVRSFSKSHGPDLRIGALGGPRALVDRVVARRLLGPGWTSRMTQALLFELLTDPVSVGEVERARDTYAARQLGLAGALRRHGLDVDAGDGINTWLRVADERDAIVRLTAAGIRVAPGGPFLVNDPEDGAGHVRVTVGVAGDDVSEIAPALADAARA